MRMLALAIAVVAATLGAPLHSHAQQAPSDCQRPSVTLSEAYMFDVCAAEALGAKVELKVENAAESVHLLIPAAVLLDHLDGRPAARSKEEAFSFRLWRQWTPAAREIARQVTGDPIVGEWQGRAFLLLWESEELSVYRNERQRNWTSTVIFRCRLGGVDGDPRCTARWDLYAEVAVAFHAAPHTDMESLRGRMPALFTLFERLVLKR